MRLAVTNLAWPSGEDNTAARILHGGAVEGVELALTRYWTDPAAVSAAEVEELRCRWTNQGFKVVALQSLLFGRPELQLFDDSRRTALLEHLLSLGTIAARLGAPVLVFGSPKQRQRGALTEQAALIWATAFFRDLAERLPEEVAIGIESNPEFYGCDFLTTPADVCAFASLLNLPAVRLHLDLACTSLAGQDPVSAARDYGTAAIHVHASEPELRPLRRPTVIDHDAAAAALRVARYQHFVSAEVLAREDWQSALVDTVASLSAAYG